VNAASRRSGPPRHRRAAGPGAGRGRAARGRHLGGDRPPAHLRAGGQAGCRRPLRRDRARAFKRL